MSRTKSLSLCFSISSISAILSSIIGRFRSIFETSQLPRYSDAR